MASKGISLSVDTHPSNEGWMVRFNVRFINDTGMKEQLCFDNRNRKAEFSNLQIYDAKGDLVVPVPGILVRPRGKQPPIELGPGDHFVYALEGKLSESGVLEFPGASFALVPGTEYAIKFWYQDRSSGLVKWKAPRH